MQRLVDVLAECPYRFIVSQGAAGAEFDLADNMGGAEFLPQTALLPLVDLVITHGGNNTKTECLHFGKPMVVLPLFWDQYDNAQRVDEPGLRPAARHLRVRGRRAARRDRPAALGRGAWRASGLISKRVQDDRARSRPPGWSSA